MIALDRKVNLVSVDEKTGIQALGRKIVRCEGENYIEHEYKRNGTTCLTAGLDVGTGKLMAHTLNDTRKEPDFLDFIKKTVAAYPEKDKLVILADNLNTHFSATLVEWVANEINFEGDLGKKRGKGILKSMESRKKFLTDSTHRIRFVYTPKHCSWLNPIENWFSKLQQQALNGRSFESKKLLIQGIEDYIKYYNKVLAKPLNWKFKGFTKNKKFKWMKKHSPTLQT